MQGGDQSEFGSTWYSRVTPLPPARAELKFEIDVDVCVIGGGLAGLTVAREVVRRGWSAAVLEAKRIAWNASGRNSGLVMPGYPAVDSGEVGLAYVRSVESMDSGRVYEL